MSQGPKRGTKYRTGANVKNLRWLRARVPNWVHDVFEMYAYDENGLRRSKGKILELMAAKLSSYRNPRID